MDTLEHLKKRTQEHWLLGQDGFELLHLVEALIEQFTDPPVPKILIAESDPLRFLAGFIAACATTPQVFLGNPTWGTSEWQQALALAQPDRIWGSGQPMLKRMLLQTAGLDPRVSCPPPSLPDAATNGLIMIPTGGSSGNVRFVMHGWQTLTAAVEGFQRYFQCDVVNSICVLPLYHVSGLMQVMRSFLSGGRLWLVPFKDLKAGWYSFDPGEFFISLVPTQLQRLLDDETLANWLVQCKTVLLGGAPGWSTLLDKARSHHILLAPCYGMTETAAQIATLKPEQFLQGNNSNGQVLPHADVQIVDAQGNPLGPDQVGKIVVRAASLARGYYPIPFPAEEPFQTDDAGFVDAAGNLHVVGRFSNTVITGGENVFPAEVEAAIRSTHLVADVAVIGLPDEYWGQVLVALYVPQQPEISFQQINEAIQGTIARFKRPKLWIPLKELPRNPQGKLNHRSLHQLALLKRPINR